MSLKTMSPIITKKQNEDAKSLSSKISDAALRKQAYADFISAMFFVDLMLNEGVIVNTKRSLFNSSKLYCDFEVVDVYCNYHRIYVVSTQNDDCVKITDKHERYGIMPEAYAVVKINAKDKQVSFIGMIEPFDLEDIASHNGYIYYPLNKLRKPSEFINKFESYADKQTPQGKHLECIKLFESYLNNNASEYEKRKLITHILTCETCKKRLLDDIKTKEFETKMTSVWHDGKETKPKIDYTSVSNEKRNQKINPAPIAKVHTEKETILNKIKKGTAENFDQLKTAIDVIYQKPDNEILEDITFKYKPEFPIKTKKIAILTGVVAFVLMLLIIGAFNIPASKKIADNEDVQPFLFEDNMEGSEDGNYDINFPELRKEKGYASVSNVSWEISSSITKDSQKRFLQQTGKTIQLNLQNDLLLMKDAVVNPKVAFEITFYRDGTLENIETVKTSGSEAVDEVIKQCITNTMHYMRPPKDSFVGKNNSITLIVEF